MFEQTRYQKGANWIYIQAVLMLDQKRIVYERIRWSIGKKHYILTVKLATGSRFARFAPICLLDYEASEIKMVIKFLLKQLIKKLDELTNEYK